MSVVRSFVLSLAIGAIVVHAEKLDGKKFSNIKCVIFDLDGTLVDSETNTGLAVNKLLDKQKIEHEGLDETACYGMTWDLCVETIFNLYPALKEGEKAMEKKEAHKKLQEYFHNGPTPEPIKKSVWAVEQAHKIIGKTAIATSSNDQSLQHSIDQLKIRSFLTTWVADEDYKRSKPDPDPYQTAAKKLGEDPKNCLVFEDSIVGIKSAKAAGASVIAILFRSPEEDLAKTLADDHIVTYEELEPDFFEVVRGKNFKAHDDSGKSALRSGMILFVAFVFLLVAGGAVMAFRLQRASARRPLVKPLTGGLAC